jgi:hypothetical protein
MPEMTDGSTCTSGVDRSGGGAGVAKEPLRHEQIMSLGMYTGPKPVTKLMSGRSDAARL